MLILEDTRNVAAIVGGAVSATILVVIIMVVVVTIALTLLRILPKRNSITEDTSQNNSNTGDRISLPMVEPEMQNLNGNRSAGSGSDNDPNNDVSLS